MSSSSFYNMIQLFWMAAQVVFSVLAICTGVIVFRRQRGAIGWTVLISAILWPLLMLGNWLVSSLAPLMGWSYSMPIMGFGLMEIMQLIRLSSTLFHMLFLGGLLFHLLQRTSEGDRIRELEAIIRDRDQEQAQPR